MQVDNLGFEKKKEKEVSLKAWGSSRKPFYGADVGDDDLSSDEDSMRPPFFFSVFFFFNSTVSSLQLTRRSRKSSVCKKKS